MSATYRAGTVAQAVVTAPDFKDRIAAHYRLAQNEALRIAFHAGPGDAAGSFDHWMTGEHDPRVPLMAYSTQFYTLIDRIDADATIVTEPPHQPEHSHPRFQFAPIARDRTKRRLGWHLEHNLYARRFVAEMRRIRPHVVVMGIDFPFWAYTALPRDTAVIISIHNTFWPMGRRSKDARSRLKLALAGRGLRRMTSAVCTSPECARQLAALTGRQAGQDAGFFVEMPQLPDTRLPPVRLREAAKNMLFLGRIEANKGVFDLLAAFCNIAGRHSDINLTFAGTGSAGPALQEAIAATPHAGRIQFPGQLSADGVLTALQAADLLICPTRSSFNEGLALVVLDAAAAGVPSLASSVVPAQELVPDACAVFPADDTDALQKTLDHLVSDHTAYQALVTGTAPARAQVLDRTHSWGSQLARAMLWPGQTS
ncbi:MAG: glycosyltransferase family 4 protein [Pararhodobacter sp.]|nr:glycosyltransferase family 4 protein [Pararhodobacter sp.]